MVRYPWTLIICEVAVFLVVLVYMSSYPIFPEIRSVDFGQHLSIARDYAAGHFQPLSAQLLYAGVEYYLAFFLVLFPNENPFTVTRIAMALLILISPAVVWIASRKIFEGKNQDRIANLTTVFYSFSGLIWVQMVFISGIYANFFGFLASLFLLTASINAVRNGNRTSYVILCVALLVAAFSHYSTVLLFPPILAYFVLKKAVRPLVIVGSPIVFGIMAFPSQITGLFGFFQPTSNITQQPTTLSPLLFIPSLQYLAEEITDIEFVFLIGCVIAFSYFALKRKSPEMLLIVGWFILSLAVAPWNSSAWRFSFIALIPGTLMVGWTLSRLVNTDRLWLRSGRIKPSEMVKKGNLILVILLLVPTIYPSWGYLAFTHSLQVSPADGTTQQNVYDAIRWIGDNIPAPGVCHNAPQAQKCNHIVSVTDWRFSYDSLFNGSQVLYAPDYHIVFTDPLQTALFAATHNSSYIITTRHDTTFISNQCNTTLSYGLTVYANATAVKPNQPIEFTVSAHVDAPIRIYDDGLLAGQVTLTNGTGSIIASFAQPGEDFIFANLGEISTSNLNFTVGGATDYTSQSASAPPTFCLPWSSFNWATLPDWILVYQNPDVKIWRAPSP